jgi:hypothetical protein
MTELTYLEQLQQLKGLTVRLGTLHEAQKLQLMNYPKLIPGVSASKCKAQVDVENKIVTYICEGPKPFRHTKTVKLFCQNINRWTKTILWDETTVIIKVNKTAIYDSRTEKRQ